MDFLKHGTNYHSHCDYCDGRAPIEDFVRAAIAAGFSAYGVSSHAPLPAYAGLNRVLQWDRVGEYIADIEALKAKYAGQIELYTSMEIDYIDGEHNPVNDYFQALNLDYRIGSVHFLKVGKDKVMDADTKPELFLESLEQYYDNDIKRLVEDYFDAKARMVSLGGFDFVGHTDKVSLNASRFDKGVTQTTWYKNLVDSYFDFVAQSGMMLELNTKAFEPMGLLFPNVEHLQRLCELGIPMVVNADSHRPELVNSGRMEAIKLLQVAGYKTIREFHHGKWQDIDI